MSGGRRGNKRNPEDRLPPQLEPPDEDPEPVLRTPRIDPRDEYDSDPGDGDPRELDFN